MEVRARLRSFTGVITRIIHWFTASPAENGLKNLFKRLFQFGEQLQPHLLEVRTAVQLKPK